MFLSNYQNVRVSAKQRFAEVEILQSKTSLPHAVMD